MLITIHSRGDKNSIKRKNQTIFAEASPAWGGLLPGKKEKGEEEKLTTFH